MADNHIGNERRRHIKVKRAVRHIAELESLLADYVKSAPAEFEITQLPAPSGQIAFAQRARIKPIPDESSAILGDIFHNLRASLDLVATWLARTTSNDDKGVYFPFSESADTLDQRIKDKKFSKCGEDAVALLKEFAPYHGGNTMLRAIHDLNIQDKHVAMIPGSAWHGPSGVDFVFPDGGPLADMPLFKTLHDLVELTDSVIAAFASLPAARK